MTVNSYAKKCLDDYDWLYNEYIIKNRTQKSICDELNVCSEYISKRIKALDIPKRKGNTGFVQTPKTIEQRVITRRSNSGHVKLYNKDWLYTEYIINKRKLTDIAIECDVHKSTVSKYLHRYDIPTRRTREGDIRTLEALEKYKETYYNNHKKVYHNKEWLVDQYINQNKTTKTISKELGVNDSTIWEWLVRFDIPRDKNSEAMKIRWSKGYYSGLPRYSLCHAGWYVRENGTKVWLRSSYERRVATKLDELCIDWLYECKCFIIDETKTTYTPDFYLPDLDIIWEVKGWVDENTSTKMNKFFRMYPNEHLKMVYLSDIEQLEQLPSNSDLYDIIMIGTEGI